MGIKCKERERRRAVKNAMIDYRAVLVNGNVPSGPEMVGQGPVGISEVESLMNEFEAHEGEEGKFTQRYKEIAEKSKNPFVKFLLQLIVSDEEKHHAVTHAIVSTLKGSLTWTRPEDALTCPYDLGEGRDELLRLTEDFIELEKDGIKEYKKLTKSCEHYYRGLFALLLKTMIRDSEKHVEILEFLRAKLREA
jgi:rubrerythrin